MSATATHFSITATRVFMSSQRRISDAIKLLTLQGKKNYINFFFFKYN